MVPQRMAPVSRACRPRGIDECRETPAARPRHGPLCVAALLAVAVQSALIAGRGNESETFGRSFSLGNRGRDAGDQHRSLLRVYERGSARDLASPRAACVGDWRGGGCIG